MDFQQLVLKLSSFWSEKGCLLITSHNTEVGAGTMNPGTFLRVLGPEPWKAAYVEPSRRPKDGRYGDNPNRVQQFNQYQVILKPSPYDVVPVFIESLEALGIDPGKHDIRFIEDDWEAPTLGAFGLGWEVWLDGMEITQFTYFQQAGGLTLDPVSTEITYGLERICMYIQGVDNIMDIEWGPGVKYGEIYRQPEKDFSAFNFEKADTGMYFDIFSRYRAEAERMIEEELVFPAYDYVLKCSHIFNLLDSRGAISVSERTSYISNIRGLARLTASAYVKRREEEGFPLLSECASD